MSPPPTPDQIDPNWPPPTPRTTDATSTGHPPPPASPVQRNQASPTVSSPPPPTGQATSTSARLSSNALVIVGLAVAALIALVVLGRCTARHGATTSTPTTTMSPTAPPARQPSTLPPSGIAPSPGTAPTGIELTPNAYGYVPIQTKSGLTRCQIEKDRFICESSADTGWPIAPDGYRYHGFSVTAAGEIQWAQGNLGAIQPVTLDYQTYHALDWTIEASSSGTRITNDRTRRGAFVSIEKVQTF